ncbi:Hypothetical protein F387_01803 [Wohlfahrtiimonas chitiniclastica SH04]|uniref:Uncharacterized protein n=1 Tax=Wohlfahrtiimonas chitiniclastica SH04 TaxID=1261130 RepID=L8XTN5_9GAMM|nr:hypothetical protein [Wohlfahrtiimonas chitiniclastica]ELV07383.1 Hypothetical protein F387_01803 [Wohlfahrtiimonas chitiniclastica SH04]
MQHTLSSTTAINHQGENVNHKYTEMMNILVELFEAFNIKLTSEQAHGSMALPFSGRVQYLLSLPSIVNSWRTQYGAEPTAENIRRMNIVLTQMSMRVE